jgi:ribosomal-protein-alanine N-acetyltransferase
VVRRASSADLPLISAIERASFSDPWTEDSFASALSLPHIHFLVAEEGDAEGRPRRPAGAGGGGLLGYVVAMVLGDEGEIADIAVAPAARRRGVGALLLDRMMAQSAEYGVRAMYLEVRESNVAARALYESRRFQQVGRRRGYYLHPAEDALLLRRDFDPT